MATETRNVDGVGGTQRVNSFKQIFFLSMFILIKLITGDHEAVGVSSAV